MVFGIYIALALVLVPMEHPARHWSARRRLCYHPTKERHYIGFVFRDAPLHFWRSASFQDHRHRRFLKKDTVLASRSEQHILHRANILVLYTFTPVVSLMSASLETGSAAIAGSWGSVQPRVPCTAARKIWSSGNGRISPCMLAVSAKKGPKL
jgi:hypothetical protein